MEALVRGFESCTTPPAEFTTPQHLVVALFYLRNSRLTVEEAAGRLRAALYRYLDHNGVDRRKYNETITLFWLRRVRVSGRRGPCAHGRRTRRTEMLAGCGSAKLINDYYSQERLFSDEARIGWVEPDLKPLDF